MKIQLAHVISDVVGETGQRMLRAIVAGERDGRVLATMKNVRIRASQDEIAKSPQGNWRAEHLFALKQALAAFDFIGTQLTECDAEIEAQMKRPQAHNAEPEKAKRRGRARNAPKFNLRERMFPMCGVDLTRIDGIDIATVLTVIAEVGPAVSRFPTLKHFASLAGLVSGDHHHRRQGDEPQDPTGRPSRSAGFATGRSRPAHQPIGVGRLLPPPFARMDKPKAVTAAAHQLVRLIHTMLTKGEEYTDQGQDYFEERYRESVVRQLSLPAEKLGLKLAADPQPV